MTFASAPILPVGEVVDRVLYRGFFVKALQQALVNAGYGVGEAGIDGRYGLLPLRPSRSVGLLHPSEAGATTSGASLQRSVTSLGSVPARKNSSRTSPAGSAQPSGTRRPVVVSIRAWTIPRGGSKARGRRFARLMKSNHTRTASRLA